jgi:hypothetical protein
MLWLIIKRAKPPALDAPGSQLEPGSCGCLLFHASTSIAPPASVRGTRLRERKGGAVRSQRHFFLSHGSFFICRAAKSATNSSAQRAARSTALSRLRSL